MTYRSSADAEQASFLADSSDNAYEKQVDRLLRSPRYGERWASMWPTPLRDTKGMRRQERPWCVALSRLGD